MNSGILGCVGAHDTHGAPSFSCRLESLLFMSTLVCVPFNLGLENEFQIGSLYQANVADLSDDIAAANVAVLYTLLDALLWLGLLVLKLQSRRRR